MAETKGKILEVDVEKKFVLMRTVISDKDWGNNGKDASGNAIEVETHVKIDFSTAGDEWIMEEASRHLRIEVRRAHLVPMGPDACRATSKAEPFLVSAENASKSGKPRSQKLEDKSVEQLQALIAQAQALVKQKKAE